MNFFTKPGSQTTSLDTDLKKHPNKYAPQSSYELNNTIARVRGYQNYDVDIDSKSIRALDKALEIKTQFLINTFLGSDISGKTCLDLGGNNGYYSLIMTACLGARQSKVIDIDKNAIRNTKRLSKDLSLEGLKAEKGNISDIKEKTDYVIAFALVHWIYNLTTQFNSLKEPLNQICNLANEALIIEWVDPTDELIQNFKHLDGKRADTNDYCKENFLQILKDNFDSVVPIGKVKNSRMVYLAAREGFWTGTKNIDLRIEPQKLNTYSGAFAIQNKAPTIIHTCTALNDDYFTKQASNPIGSNEAIVLSTLDHECIPKLVDSIETEGFTLMKTTKAPGTTLSEILESRSLAIEEQEDIIDQLEKTISYLKTKKIAHRDITPNNIMWCPDSKQMTLIDFAWATQNNHHPTDTPPTLGLTQDKNFCNYIDNNEPRNDDYAAAMIFRLLGNNEATERAITRRLLEALNQDKALAKKILDMIHRASTTKK